MAQKMPASDFMQATGHSMRFVIPKGEFGEREVEWHVPERWNALERNRGRAYHYLFSQLVALESLLEAYKLMKQGETRVAAMDPNELEGAIPKDERRSVGWWGAGRGWLTHHLVMDKGKITNYQICTPSTINASPRPLGPAGAVRGSGDEHPDHRGRQRPVALHQHRHAPEHPQLRPVHAVHHPRPHRGRRSRARGQHLLLRW